MRCTVLAGGGSLSAPVAVSGTFRLRSFAVMILSAVVVVVADHLTKWWVATSLPLDGEWPMGAPFVIRHVENRGAAFSLLPQAQWLFLAVAAVVCVYILFAGHRFGSSLYRQTVLGVILGGAASNAIDRLSQEYVVDFIDMRHWPVFNIADIAICCGIALAVFTFRPAGDARNQG